jgi:REP element-mobilizing transposase RayT
MIPRSIGSIVKGFKIGVTKWCRANTNIKNVWQRNYHDHVIRNQQSYETIADYIISNPSKWKDDKFFKA